MREVLEAVTQKNPAQPQSYPASVEKIIVKM